MRRCFKKYVCILMILIFLSGCGRGGDSIYCDESSISTEESFSTVVAEEETAVRESAIIYVHVCGQVKNPGLYELSGDARVGAAIQAAGGFTKEADEASINLAEYATDGSQIYVASIEENKETRTGGSGTSPSDKADRETNAEGLININTASVTELTTLSGIGDSRAEAIVEYRTEHGAFSSIEEIKEVSGIGDSIYDKIKDKITVG